MTQEAYIYDAVRTPRGRGKRDGALYDIPAIDLVATVLRAIQKRSNLDTSQVDDVILGCVAPVGEQGADIARMAVLHAGWDVSVPGVQENRFCASGLEAVNLAAMKVRSGWEDLVVGGGVESMSRVPMGSDGGAMIFVPRVSTEIGFVPQGVSADAIATMEGIGRLELDEFALRSQRLAVSARAEGRFRKSIIPVLDIIGQPVLDQDEYPRPDATLEKLGELKPAFQAMGDMGFDAVAMQRYPGMGPIRHVHTAGNSSGIVDGAAAVLIASKEKGDALGLQPRARLVASAVVGTDPTIMLAGPGPASLKALGKAGMTIRDIDLFEVNEAFAVVPLRFMRDVGLTDMDRINVNGGAIALGHPLGATGAMLLGAALDELERSNRQTALITLCTGGGMGIATIIERT